MTRLAKGIGLSAVMVFAMSCGTDNSQDPLDGSDIVFLQRASRGGMGDILQYTSYIAGAKLVKLSPATADGTLSVLCCVKRLRMSQGKTRGQINVVIEPAPYPQ